MRIAEYMLAKGLNDAALGALIGVSGDLVRLWRLGQRVVGAKRVLKVEEVTKIPRHELRPDLYPPPVPRKRQHSAVSESPAD